MTHPSVPAGQETKKMAPAVVVYKRCDHLSSQFFSFSADNPNRIHICALSKYLLFKISRLKSHLFNGLLSVEATKEETL